MMLVAHIFIALFSLIYTTYLFMRPTKGKLKVSYGLVTATLTSGFYLVVSTRSHLLQACMMGLLYVGLISLGIVSASRKLAKEAAFTKD